MSCLPQGIDAGLWHVREWGRRAAASWCWWPPTSKEGCGEQWGAAEAGGCWEVGFIEQVNKLIDGHKHPVSGLEKLLTNPARGKMRKHPGEMCKIRRTAVYWWICNVCTHTRRKHK